MARRRTKNRTGIPRIAGTPYHDPWIQFTCVACRKVNVLHIGPELITAKQAFETAQWGCEFCEYIHERGAPLPFKHWPRKASRAGSIAARRFWQAFFVVATERTAHAKQCNTCGRVLPFSAFARHRGWGPLERQMECRACKAAINAILNPKRTAEQLHEGSARRRAGDLLMEGENEAIDFDDLFRRFDGRCFKLGKALDRKDRRSWAVDHILPSRYLYPLTKSNAALLSREANENKRDRWPSDFYDNSELIRLAELTGADLSLISSPQPVMNPRVDVNRCVTRALRVREKSELHKRIVKLRQFLVSLHLESQLSAKNKMLLGLE